MKIPKVRAGRSLQISRKMANFGELELGNQSYEFSWRWCVLKSNSWTAKLLSLSLVDQKLMNWRRAKLVGFGVT